MLLFFLSSGLFLGWSLGSNDAANVFGSAVGSRMLKFRTAAIIASIFVILGAVIQGAGASQTLGKLGSVSALAGSFTVALSAAVTVFTMVRWKIPVSSSQAVVGAIIGWNFYTGNPTDINSLTKIMGTWVMGPVLGAVFSILIYLALSSYLNRAKIHIVKLDAYVRTGLIVVGAFGSYSLGANNIANVMGVFVPAIPLDPIDFGLFVLNGSQQLFLLGGLAIAVGIITYSKRIMRTVGNDLMELSPVSALVVVLAHSMVLFIFSSQSLSNFVHSLGLPAIPLVPISSSQAIVGAIIGLGLLKGGRNVNLKILGGISLGWITTPIIAGVVAFLSLFFVNNVFKLEVVNPATQVMQKVQRPIEKTTTPLIRADSLKTDTSEALSNKLALHTTTETLMTNYALVITISLIALLILVLVYGMMKRRKLIKKNNQNTKELISKIKLLESKIKALQKKNEVANKNLESEVRYKKKQMMTLAINIIQKNEFIQKLKNKIIKLKSFSASTSTQNDLQKISLLINEHLYLDKDRQTFQIYVEELHQNFYLRLDASYPNLTNNEKRLCALLRLDLSSKEIASVLNISPKSVEMNRYRLRKKMKIAGSDNLSAMIQKL
jgi:phosphate/sulfate permease/DNA-binding CsgD family transcriptional regulator